MPLNKTRTQFFILYVCGFWKRILLKVTVQGFIVEHFIWHFLLVREMWMKTILELSKIFYCCGEGVLTPL